MLHEIEAKTKVRYQDYYVLRGIKQCDGLIKKVVIEECCDNKPTETDIAEFLMRHKKDIDFASIEHNYMLLGK